MNKTRQDDRSPFVSGKSAPVTVIILNYNGADVVKRCVRSFAAQRVLPKQVLFIDNGSSDFDQNELRSLFGTRYSSRLRFLAFKENLGYSKGMNRGLAWVLAEPNPTEWIMTLNNDTALEEDFFESLLKVAEAIKDQSKCSLGMLSPKVLSMSSPDELDAAGLVLSLDGMSSARGQREKDLRQYDDKLEVLAPNGVSAIYRASMLRQIGLYDERFEAYCEDTDLGFRAWLAGWNCRFEPALRLYHSRSTSHGNHSLRKLYLVERNHFWFAIKNYPAPLLILGPAFTAWRYLVQAYSIARKRGQGRGFSFQAKTRFLVFATLRALFDALRGSPEMFLARIRLRRLRKRSEIEVLTTLWRGRLNFQELILKE
ncbi:MAG: glycosyltransferase family 2 protein [Bdellovibrionota bacterium]